MSMRIGVDLSSLKQAKLREEAGRFLLGGAITVLAGLISRRYGPVIGGLFLAFPAIFPAGATLIEKHETERKRRVGCDGRRRGREAAALDALGASMGSMGLAAFAVVLWRWLPKHGADVSLVMAIAAWMLVSGGLWILRKRIRFDL